MALFRFITTSVHPLQSIYIKLPYIILNHSDILKVITTPPTSYGNGLFFRKFLSQRLVSQAFGHEQFAKPFAVRVYLSRRHLTHIKISSNC